MLSDHATGMKAASGWEVAHPEFGVSVNPIPTRGADYTHRITACPPGFENLSNGFSVCYKSKCPNLLK